MSEQLLSEILDELKKIRFALQDRSPTPSGGAFPPNPKVEMNKDHAGVWRCHPVPGEEAAWKDCKDACGTKVLWVTTQFGNRTIEPNGKQHRCPNYVPGAKRATAEDLPLPKPVGDEDAEVPF
jgi:hypothetical protein